MIPTNITKESIIKAIELINSEGVPKKRESTKYNIRYMEKFYPPKYTVSLANKFVNGKELESYEFGGGLETNNFLINLGFEIADTFRPKIDMTENIEKDLKIGTVLIESFGPPDKYMLAKIIKEIGNHIDILIFPAGFYETTNKPDSYYNDIEKEITDIINQENLDIIVCLGIDGRKGKDQIGLAINKLGIISVGRKFYPTDSEKGFILAAKDYLADEGGYSRLVEVKNRKFYLSICYDGFGIRKLNLSNPGVDGVINLVHGFHRQGFGGSGEVYFAKHGFAGTSKQWGCVTFGSATFFNRHIPENWPAAVLWNQGHKSTSQWKYTDNAIQPVNEVAVQAKNEIAKVRIYKY
ncbi:hypothetical protein [Tissierella sp.]|uniref:hypothetical protein n=1 Tax=Tissierella sp. TaxID=41274 RepID=UPI0030307BD6